MILWEEEGSYKDLKEDLERLLKCVADLPGPPQGTRHGQKETSIAGDRRARILSKIWANEMNQDPGVQKFRDEHLEGKTLQSFDEVDRWLDIQAFGEEQWYDDKQPGVIGPSWETIMQESILGFYDPRMRIDEASQKTQITRP